MNLNMIRPKNEKEDLLLSITRNCQTLIDQTHREAEETLEFKMNKLRETFHFKPSIQTQGSWMIGLTSLEVHNSIFNITEGKNKFELYGDSSNKFGFLEIKDELEEIPNVSHISQEHLQDEIIGPRLIDEFLKLSHEKKNSDGYMIIFLGYTRSPFRDFESYLRIVVGLHEEDIQLILKQYKSHFISYELTPRMYTIQDITDAVNTFSGQSEIIQIEYDDNTMKTIFILKYIAGQKKFALRTLIFDERSFFHTLLDFEQYWDYKPTNSNHVAIPGVYTSDKILNFKTTNKIHLKCDVIDGSVVNGCKQSNLFCFVLDKKPGYKIFSEPEINHYKKINKSDLNTATFI